MKRLVFVSDTHGYLQDVKLPEGDILVHAGDLSSVGEITEISKVMYQFEKLLSKYSHIIFIAGNHDKLYERNLDLAKSLIYEKNIHYLQDEELVIDGIKFYGSPWTLEFFDWAFMYDRDESGKEIWAKIPEDTDVLISHSPPYGKLDKVTPWGHYTEEHAGCKHLLERVLEVKPKVHVFGHIHGSHGYIQGISTLYINASSCDENYRAVNKPFVVDIDEITKEINVISPCQHVRNSGYKIDYCYKCGDYISNEYCKLCGHSRPEHFKPDTNIPTYCCDGCNGYVD
jgi:Icc-related predicted phosphoesterase